VSNNFLCSPPLAPTPSMKPPSLTISQTRYIKHSKGGRAWIWHLICTYRMQNEPGKNCPKGVALPTRLSVPFMRKNLAINPSHVERLSVFAVRRVERANICPGTGFAATADGQPGPRGIPSEDVFCREKSRRLKPRTMAQKARCFSAAVSTARVVYLPHNIKEIHWC
jgi:hypothetical protein